MFSPGESEMNTMANTNVNTSFSLENSEEQQSSSADEVLNDQKPFEYFDWKVQYAEEDVLELPVDHYGKTIMLKAYRFPPKEYRKGVVFYIHGYGSYANQNGMLAKCLAEHNYEVFAIDQRGFGFSDGERAIIQNKDDLYND